MSKQWKHADSLTPKNTKSLPSSGTVMLSVFWDRRGVILTDYMQNGITVTGKYCRNLLRNLWEEIKKKQRRMLGKGVRLLHNNVPAHAAHATMTPAASLGYEILPRLKKPLHGKRFLDDDDIIFALEDFLNSQNESF
jgi:hypothetical protein